MRWAGTLALVINERGELLAFKLTPANTDDRVPVPELTQGLIGKLFGDRGYIRQELFEELYEAGTGAGHERQAEDEKQTGEAD